jgi:hypothetical protein
MDQRPNPMLLPREQSIYENLMIPTWEPILASDKHHSTFTVSYSIAAIDLAY